jgi:uncharacterized protein (DUF58 family)
VSRARYERRPFPLVPRRRLAGLPFGELPSRRRGQGADVIGSRPYEPRDPVSTIDWYASARLSAASGTDEFVVRDRAADEAPRVAILCDRRPAMALYPSPLPWLDKAAALWEAVNAIVTSALFAHSDVASLDFAGGEAYWLPPGRREQPWLISERQRGAPFDAPEDSLDRGLAQLATRRATLPRGSFVFVLSDFLAPPPAAAWLGALANDWDLVPVVIQDPVWERSFPPVGSVAVPVADPRTGSVALVRLSRSQAAERRAANEARFARLLDELRSLDLEPVVLATSDPLGVDRAFLEWAEVRRQSRWAR